MPSKTAKTRKHNRTRAHKELSARRTEASRARRLENKAKREAIHAIDPDAKVRIIGHNMWVDGIKAEIIAKKLDIVPSALPKGAIKTECDYEDAVIEYQEIMDTEDKIVMDGYAISEITAVKPEEPDCKLPAEKKSWKQVLREWTNS